MTQSIQIQHARNGGEKSVIINGNNYKVDGYCEQNNTIYQFHGCYFHGCLRCHKSTSANHISHYKFGTLHTNTLKIGELLKTKLNLGTIWEHDFGNNKDMRTMTLEDYDVIIPPNIRNAFFGGRTKSFNLIYDFNANNTKGKYIDVCSLYPTVMYYDPIPIGHPDKTYK